MWSAICDTFVIYYVNVETDPQKLVLVQVVLYHKAL